jgi:hypothetical protein
MKSQLSSEDDFMTVIWGRVDRNMYDGVGGLVRGAGEISFLVPASNATPPDSLNGTFEVQAATWSIPETSSAWLVSLVGLTRLVQRCRGKC